MAMPCLQMLLPQQQQHHHHSPSFHRTIKHYSNLQDILLVGDGDFSFSNVLAVALGSGHKIVATSLDSEDTVLSRYGQAAAFNLSNLRRLGALLFHGVDATCMACHEIVGNLSFDCIVYNFPHAGFFGPEEDKQVIRRHKLLVKMFFDNATKLLRRNGEVHVSHKVKPPYCKWKLEKQAAKCGLVLKDCCDFARRDYPGYVNRRGDGAKSGNSFYLGKCKTFKFILNPSHSQAFHPFRRLLDRGSNLMHRRIRKPAHPRKIVPLGFPAVDFQQERPQFQQGRPQNQVIFESNWNPFIQMRMDPKVGTISALRNCASRVFPMKRPREDDEHGKEKEGQGSGKKKSRKTMQSQEKPEDQIIPES